MNPADLGTIRHVCEAKKRFATQAEAIRYQRPRRIYQRAYKCPHCDYWHLTTRRVP